MSKTHFYTQKLLNTLWKYVNVDVNKNSPQYAFTQGIIYSENALFATDTKLMLKASIPDVPKELKGSVCDSDENSLTDWQEKNLETLEKICSQSRTKSFILNIDKWEEAYEKLKNRKIRSFETRISPLECIKLNDDFYVKIKDFNKAVKFCKNNNCRLIKYNDNSYSITNDYLQLIGVNYNYWFDEEEKFETCRL